MIGILRSDFYKKDTEAFKEYYFQIIMKDKLKLMQSEEIINE